MRDSLAAACDIHDDPYECADVVVVYSKDSTNPGSDPRRRHVSDRHLVLSGCGAKLPDSQRDRWFDEIEALGLDSWTDEIPRRYESEEWLRS